MDRLLERGVELDTLEEIVGGRGRVVLTGGGAERQL